MAEAKFGKGSEEWQMFVDFWALCQKYWITEDNDKYWSELVDDSVQFTEKYKGDEFARALALAFGNSQDRKHKNKQRKE